MAKNRRLVKGVLQKQCSGCGRWRPLTRDHFYRSGLGRYNDKCRTCLNGDETVFDKRGFFVPIDERTGLPLDGARAGILSFNEVHVRLRSSRLSPGVLLEQGDDQTIIARYRVTDEYELEKIEYE